MADDALDVWRRSAWTARPAHRPDRAPAFEIAVVVLLVLWNAAANTAVPGVAEIPVNVLVAGVLLWLARRNRLSWDRMGLRRTTLRSGIRLGAFAAGVVVAAVAVVAVIPASRELIADLRFAEVGPGEMLYDVFLRIPIGTALSEEIAFRGVVLGMLLWWMSPLKATLLSSALFGLWHVLPGIAALDTAVVDVGGGTAGDIGAVAGQVIVTGISGIVFCWLRLRGRHLVAPVIAHWALNASAFAAGWLVVRYGWA